jgi:hypothetical protein
MHFKQISLMYGSFPSNSIRPSSPLLTWRGPRQSNFFFFFFEFLGDEKRVGPFFGFHFPLPLISPLPLLLTSFSVPAMNDTRSRSLLSQSRQRMAPYTTIGNVHPRTQLKIQRRHPLNATRGSPPTTPTRSDREPPTGHHPQSPSTPATRYCAQTTHLQIRQPNGLLSPQFSLPHKQNPRRKGSKSYVDVQINLHSQ